MNAAKRMAGEDIRLMDTEFHIRKAKDKDIDEIMALYEQARAYMAENGNPGQWTNGYPAREDVETDLNRNVLYICESSDGIEGVFMLRSLMDSCTGSLPQAEKKVWQRFVYSGV